MILRHFLVILALIGTPIGAHPAQHTRAPEASSGWIREWTTYEDNAAAGVWIKQAQAPPGGIIGVGSFESWGESATDGFVAWINPSGAVKRALRIGGSTTKDAFSCAALCSDGGILAAGLGSYNDVTSSGLVWLCRFGPSGNLVWQRQVKKKSGWTNSEVEFVRQVPDGGFIVCWRGEDVASAKVFMKVDSSGKVVWQKLFELSGFYDGAGQGRQYAPTSDGGIIIVGGGNEIPTGLSLLAIVQINTDGAARWAKEYVLSEPPWGQYTEYCAVPSKASSYFIVGDRSTGIAERHDFMDVLKIDESGNLVRAQTLDSGILDAGDLFYVNGGFGTPDGGALLHYCYLDGKNTAYAIRLAASGNLLWANAWDSASILDTPGLARFYEIPGGGGIGTDGERVIRSAGGNLKVRNAYLYGKSCTASASSPKLRALTVSVKDLENPPLSNAKFSLASGKWAPVWITTKFDDSAWCK